MRIAFIGRDKDGALNVRKSNRDAHVAYLKSTDTVEMAGPLLDDAGEMIGSLVILNLADMAAAQEWAAHDPYAKAELFKSFELVPWNKVIG